jgi:hypothetical protein
LNLYHHHEGHISNIRKLYEEDVVFRVKQRERERPGDGDNKIHEMLVSYHITTRRQNPALENQKSHTF